ncbi:MAG: DnaA regulatory inactivator Hda [Gammaproteobacteria bacterium]|nr:DnaA regulatory inactivator Hda [Gammaproteobacteria bacterium]
MTELPTQLPFNFSINQQVSLDDYIVGDNGEMMSELFNDHSLFLFIWSANKLGKTHLLTALNAQYLAQKKTALLVPLKNHQFLHPSMLTNLENADIVCIDDIDAIAGNKEWEHSLFHFYNKIKAKGNRLIVSACKNAVNIDFALADLRSRLQWGLTYEIKELNDDDLLMALKNKSLKNHFQLSHEVSSYLLNQFSRDLSKLLKLLDELAYQSLSKQRKITVPFVKEYLNGSEQ